MAKHGRIISPKKIKGKSKENQRKIKGNFDETLRLEAGQMNLQPLLEQAFAASRSKDYLTAWTLIRRYWRLRDAGANAPPGGDRRAFGVADVSNYHHYNVHGSY